MIWERAMRGGWIVMLFVMGLSAISGAADVAPIPDEVIEAVVHRPLKQGRNLLPQAVEQSLEQEVQVLDELDAVESSQADATARAQAFEQKRSHLAAGRNELKALRAEVRRQIATERARLLALQLGDKAAALDAFMEQIEQRFEAINGALDAVDRSNAGSRGKAVKSARSYLGKLLRKMQETEPIPTEPIITFRQDTPLKSQPQEGAEDVPQYLSETPGRSGVLYAFNGDTLLAAAPPDPHRSPGMQLHRR